MVVVVAAVVVGAAVSWGLMSDTESPADVYADANQHLQESLAEEQISMSEMINFDSSELVAEFCHSLIEEASSTGDDLVLNRAHAGGEPVERCTSTEIFGRSGEFIGNIHMIGSQTEPTIVVGAVQAGPDDSPDDVVATFHTMVSVLVCDCWEEAMILPAPETQERKSLEGMDGVRIGYDSLESMILDIGAKYADARFAASGVIKLEGHLLQIILLSNASGTEWQLRII